MANSLDEELLRRQEEEKLEAELNAINQRQRLIKIKSTVKQTVDTEVKTRVSGSEGQQQRPGQVRQQEPGQEEEPEREDQDQDQDEEKKPREDEDEEKKPKDEEEPEEEGKKPKKEKPEGKGEPEAGEGAQAGEGAAEAAEGAEAAEAGAAAGEAGAAAGAAGTAAATEGTAAVAVGTSEFWIPALAIIGGIILIICLGLFILTVMIAKCNETGLVGGAARIGSTVSSWVGIIPSDICDKLAINSNSVSQNGGGGTTVSGKLTDAQARAQLATAGIAVNAPQPQTSLEGINQGTIDEIIMLKKNCDAAAGNCTVIFTGGTESGIHAAGACSHGNGYKFDVGLNNKLTNYIRTTFTPAGVRSDGAVLYTSPASGALYALEGNHWDVAVGCNSTNE